MTDIITGNYFDKYGSSNPLVRWVVSRYLATLYRLLDRIPIDSLLDAGCGEGEIIDRLIERYSPAHVTALDLDPKLIRDLATRHPKHRFRVASLEDYQDDRSYDVILCLEVLEHIPDYRTALASLARIPASTMIFSVPNEPFFRAANLARLRYLRRLGNTPGHVNNFTLSRFNRVLRRAFPGSTVATHPCYIWSFGIVTPGPFR